MRARLAELLRGRELEASVVAAAVLGLLLTVVPALDQPLLLLASAGLLVVVGALGTWLIGERGRIEWTTSSGFPPRPRGSDRRVTALTRPIDRAVPGNPGEADAGVGARPELQAAVRSVAEAHLIRLGLPTDLHDDGTRAALGPELTAYLVSSPPTRIGATDLDTFITTLEEH